MLQYHTSKQKISLLLLLIIASLTAHTQVVKRVQPIWWFGQSVAANFNEYQGTTQKVNNSLSVPTAFHKGEGTRPYASLLLEYRPNRVLGGMLNLAYDNRGGKFETVMAPCNCPANLSTNLSYFVIEPSLRLAPFSSGLYFFAGPTISFNVSRSFRYEQEKQTIKTGEWSEIRKTLLSAQGGLGIDIPISARTSATQWALSPFASFQTDFGRNPRDIETWAIYTVRAGMALKFGARKVAPITIQGAPVVTTLPPVTIMEKDIMFSVRAPKVVPISRQVKETFPLRNSVFFDQGSTAIPTRYIQLNSNQAAAFRETQLQQAQPDNLNSGRSYRQLAVYHNILNIMGDRLRSNPQSRIALSGASDKDPVEGRVLAENIKQYLVSVYGIDGSRISTEGRDKPVIPSEQPGATRELALLREGDRRVDIESVSPELLMQVGGSTSPFLKPVEILAIQEDPLDSHVILTNTGANELLNSWSVQVTDEQGKVQQYGPYTQDQASIPGKTILGNNTQGNYKIMMMGQSKTGRSVTRESSVSLMRMSELKQQGLRYSILFDFDREKSLESYEAFLRDVVTPLIPEDATVIIHGHTDVIGEEAYNHTLSHNRAMGAQRVIQQALSARGTRGVKFETYGFGEDEGMAPFENNLPEKRFYNRTVIIDVVPNK